MRCPALTCSNLRCRTDLAGACDRMRSLRLGLAACDPGRAQIDQACRRTAQVTGSRTGRTVRNCSIFSRRSKIESLLKDAASRLAAAPRPHDRRWHRSYDGRGGAHCGSLTIPVAV